jgi:hypothetical protein
MAIGLAMAVSAPVTAGTVVCDGSMVDTTIDGDLVVKAGSPLCDLDNVEVTKNIKIEAGGKLRAVDSYVGSSILGGVGAVVVVLRTTVGNDVNVNAGTRVRVVGSTVARNLVIQKTQNEGFNLDVIGNEVGGTVNLVANLSAALTVSDNTIGGDLKCDKNDPAPMLGDGDANVVAGQKLKQCVNL